MTMEQAAKIAVMLTLTKTGRVHASCASGLASKLSDLSAGKALRIWTTPRTGFPKKCQNVQLAADVLGVLGVALEVGNDAPRGGNTGDFYSAKHLSLIPEIGELVAVVEEFTKLAKNGGDAGRIAANAARSARPYLIFHPEHRARDFAWIPAISW